MCLFALMNFVWAALASLLRSLSLVAKSRGYSSCGPRASHGSGFPCYGAQALGRSGFSSYGTGAQLPFGLWDLSGPGIELVSPALMRQILNHWTTRKVQ